MPLKGNTKMSELFSGDRFQLFLDSIAEIESKGVYDIKGGSNDHYDGKYQLGEAAKKDAGEILGIDLGHTASARESFRKDPELQERAMKALVMKNHQSLSNKQGESYTSLPEAEQLAILGYAHNQGAGGASKWMSTGEVGEDGFGTAGTKYVDSIRDNLGIYGYNGLGDLASLKGEEFMNLAGDAKETITSLYDDSMNWLDGFNANPASASTYTAISGDDPYTIAQRHGISLEELASLNPEVGNALQQGKLGIGQQLNVRYDDL